MFQTKALVDRGSIRDELEDACHLLWWIPRKYTNVVTRTEAQEIIHCFHL